jgi:hypothetical protein
MFEPEWVTPQCMERQLIPSVVIMRTVDIAETFSFVDLHTSRHVWFAHTAKWLCRQALVADGV